MTRPPTVQIPFSVAVDCGFEGACFARNISKNGLYIEAPVNEKSNAVKQGMAIQILVAPFGSSPSAMVQGKIFRIESITRSDGSEGIGIGIQFKNLSEEHQGVLQRHIANYLHNTLPSDDLRALGRSVYEQFRDQSLPSDETFQPIRDFLAKLPVQARGRIDQILSQRFESSATWLVGHGYLMEIGLQMMTLVSQGGDATEKQNVMDRMNSQVAAFQNELMSDSNSLDVADHTTRKELAEMVRRLTHALKKASQTLDIAKQDEPVSTGMEEKYVGVFYDTVFFESYFDGKIGADLLDTSAAELIGAIEQDWNSFVQEKPGAPEAVAALIKRLRLLGIKIMFETRQLHRTKPLAKDLSAIVPHVKEASVEFLELQKQVKAMLEASPKDVDKEPLSSLARGSKYLANAAMELQKFVSTLPVTPEQATTFYKEVQPRKIIFDPKKSQKRRRTRRSVEVPKSVLYGSWIALLLVFAFLHRDVVWGWIYQMIPGGVGDELGVVSFHIDGDTFEGVVSETEWKALPVEAQKEQGEKFAQKLVGRGIPRVFLRTPKGDLVAKTMNFEGRRVWIVADSLKVEPTPTPTATPSAEPTVTNETPEKASDGADRN